MPLDPGMAELATIKVAEEIEIMTVGSENPFSYGGGTIYGFLNFPQRSLKTDMTIPTGTNGDATIADVLALRQMLIDNRHFGPYMLYVNSQWSQYLDTDYSTTKQSPTLRQRILALPDIQDIRTLDFLPHTNFHMVLWEQKAMTARAVVGLEAQTVQWESMGGLMKHYKVMAINVPQLRPDTAGFSGIAHGRTP